MMSAKICQTAEMKEEQQAKRTNKTHRDEPGAPREIGEMLGARNGATMLIAIFKESAAPITAPDSAPASS